MHTIESLVTALQEQTALTDVWRQQAEMLEAELRVARAEKFDFVAHLAHQAEWSAKTFGPGMRTLGVCDHIRKELKEIEADPADLKEWVDVVILALDGAWRCGGSPQQIIDGIVAKQAKNEARNWPDWRTADPNKAIEHDRSSEAAATLAVTVDCDEFWNRVIAYMKGTGLEGKSLVEWCDRHTAAVAAKAVAEAQKPITVYVNTDWKGCTQEQFIGNMKAFMAAPQPLAKRLDGYYDTDKSTESAPQQHAQAALSDEAHTALRHLREHVELTYKLCCGTAPKQSVGELLEVVQAMPEWKVIEAALISQQPVAAPADSSAGGDGEVALPRKLLLSIRSALVDAQYLTVVDELDTALAAAPAVQVLDERAIPVGVCWSEQRCEFYRADTGVSMGREFYCEWRDCCDMFPDRDTARAALASQASKRAVVTEPWKWLVSWGMGDEELCNSEALAKREKRLLEENGWESVVIEPVYRAAPSPAQTQPVVDATRAPDYEDGYNNLLFILKIIAKGEDACDNPQKLAEIVTTLPWIEALAAAGISGPVADAAPDKKLRLRFADLLVQRGVENYEALADELARAAAPAIEEATSFGMHRAQFMAKVNAHLAQQIADAAPVEAKPVAEVKSTGQSATEPYEVGKFYWVYIVLDPDARNEWENDDMPARFAGYDDSGNETWNFLDRDAIEWPCRRVQFIAAKPAE